MLTTLERICELDNTLVVVTSDNGMPFPRVKGQMYEADFRLPLAIRWGAGMPGGRVIDDFISFIDFAPTFLEAAGLPVPPEVTGSSFLDVLRSERSGQVDPGRDRVLLGRERHDLGREDDLGYPVRCLRTRQWLYVRNFAPDRWPAGNPETGFTNIDSSPTKSLILEQHERGQDRYYDLAMGKRPADELYRVEEDPDCLHNLAEDPAHAEIKQALWSELEATLRRQGDPRVFGRGYVFESYPYTGDDSHSWKARVEGRWQPQRF
jgi:N-sulfoglucosamine sulfohydrolase